MVAHANAANALDVPEAAMPPWNDFAMTRTPQSPRHVSVLADARRRGLLSARADVRLFVSHGTHDQVLAIDRCSRRLVPRLKRAGYSVEYREFAGARAVPSEMAERAVSRMLEPS